MMPNTLFAYFPNAADLIALQPEALGPVLLKLALSRLQSSGVQFDAVIEAPVTDITAGRDWPFDKKPAVIRAANSAWLWLEREAFIERMPGQNGQHGWYNLTAKGARVAEGHDIQQFLAARDFPKSLLHPLIRDVCMAAMMRSANGGSADELRSAVQTAFTTVEDTVRKAAGYSNEHGAGMLQQAFQHSAGPLRDTDTSKPEAERQALANFFGSSYTRFRNGPSHHLRPLTLTEAQDCFLLASHLLRLVEAQAANTTP